MSKIRWEETTALFGGTFDPPHLGHREAVRGLFKIPRVKRVLIIPNATPPHKTSFAPTESRVALTRLNFSSTPADPFPAEVAVDLSEIERAEQQKKPSYTYDTLADIKRRIPNLAFVVGADELHLLPKWWRFPEVLQLANWIVLERKPDHGMANPRSAGATLAEWEASGLAIAESQRTEMKAWRLKPGNTFLTLAPTDAPALSSTTIRETIGRTGEPPQGALLPEVVQYLKLHGLYGSSKVSSTKGVQ